MVDKVERWAIDSQCSFSGPLIWSSAITNCSRTHDGHLAGGSLSQKAAVKTAEQILI